MLTSTAPKASLALLGPRSPDPERQKQVDEAIRRAFEQKPPKGKCRATITQDHRFLTFYHYHHTLLVYDLALAKAVMTWSEKPTDRRILRAALANLDARYPASK